ncbi:MAG: FHA domain-containing protein [Hyphomicrobium sp.]
MTETTNSQPGAKAGRFLGSLKDALVAASRDDTQGQAKTKAAPDAVTKPIAKPGEPTQKTTPEPAEPTGKEACPAAAPATMSAAEAARVVKAQMSLKSRDKHVEFSAPPTTRVVRGSSNTQGGPTRTQLVRGKVQVERGEFGQDPVVGWLVVVGGPGIGAHRPVFEGNNTLGRSGSQRIPLDFGDDSISSEEQAYIRYDSSSRSFLFVPNLAKTNVVSINDKRPTGAVELNPMDVLTMGRTQLVFVPFCGTEFDWAELTDAKG